MLSFEYWSPAMKSATCYGLSIVCNKLRQLGREVNYFQGEDGKNILASLFWLDHIYDYIKWRRKYRLKDSFIVVGGNAVSANPAGFLPFVSAAYIGDGECWDGLIEHGSIILPGTKTAPVVWATSPNIFPISYQDVQTSKRDFCEISRGCKNKCRFCQYGWTKQYREAPLMDIVEVLLRAKTKTIRLFAADRFQHTNYKHIRSWMDSHGKTDSGSDVSMRFLLKHKEYLQFTKKVRIGIEGVSERLRRAVGKPATEEEIVEFVKLVVGAGIKSIDWYMIYGLPGERREDYLEWGELIKRLSATVKNVTIAVHWNLFTPSAQTPLQWEGVCDDYDSDWRLDIMRNKTAGLTIMHKPYPLASKHTAIKRMLSIRSTRETHKLVYDFAIHESQWKKRHNLLLAEYKNITGVDLLSSWPTSKKLPWDDYVIYPRDKCLAQKEKYWAVLKGSK